MCETCSPHSCFASWQQGERERERERLQKVKLLERLEMNSHSWMMMMVYKILLPTVFMDKRRK
jgi:hypothetical protein